MSVNGKSIKIKINTLHAPKEVHPCLGEKNLACAPRAACKAAAFSAVLQGNSGRGGEREGKGGEGREGKGKGREG